MCNAKKHSPGCTCGFGPPYPPNYRITEVTAWEDVVVDHPTLVTRGLRQEGWDAQSIQTFATRFAALQREQMPRGSRVDRVRELLRLRKRVIEDTWSEVVDVPLHRFGAPPVRGARVEYSEGDTATRASGWKLNFAAVGVAASTSVEVTRAHTSVATDGAWKQVYVPVMVQVSRVAVYDGDTLVGHGHEAQVAPPSESGDPLLQKRGVRSVDGAAAMAGGNLDYHDMVDLALSGDVTGAVHKERRSWITDVAREVSIPLSKLVDVSALVRVKRTRQLELAFELPAGHDYRAYLCNGFTYWDLPRGTLAKASRRSAARGTAA
jgi:hypothetical protein